MEKWYWIELIGFDNKLPDLGVRTFLDRVGKGITGVSIFLYSSEFINSYDGLKKEKKFDEGYCSYGAHPYNEERKRQVWTNFQLKKLVDLLREAGVKVVFSTFSTFIYYLHGKLRVGKYGEKHLDIRENVVSPRVGNFGAVSVIKRFEDGGFYADYFLAQVKRIIQDYGFDGVHFADGIPFPIQRIQTGDYSDDLVLRFAEKYGVVLPDEISGRCDGDNEKTVARWRFILENHRANYTEFWADLYGDFFKRAYRVLNEGQLVMFNGVWTRDPFEGLFRYGIDNERLLPHKAHSLIFENMSASMSLFSTQETGGIVFDEAFRRNVQYVFYLTLASLKAYSPRANIVNLTPIKDTHEQWNLVENHSNQLVKGMALRNSNFVMKKGRFVKSSGGSMYCLSDGLNEHLWSIVNRAEEISDLKRICGFYGAAFVFADDLSAELKEYIQTRKLHSYEIRKRMVESGLDFTVACDTDSLEKLNCPVVCTNLENYTEGQLARLESYGGVVAVITYGKGLSKPADGIISLEEGDLKCYLYNLREKIGEVVVENKVGVTDLSPYDEFGGVWTASLKFENVNDQFFAEIKKVIADNYALPTVVSGDGRVFCYQISKKKYRVYLYNDNDWFTFATVKLPFGIKTAKSLMNATALKGVNGDEMTVKLMNKGVEIIECVRAEE